jgi:formylglycine-generating enzyme required for sulfatase activity
MHLLAPIDTRVRIRDRMALVCVPEGQLEMGSDQDEQARPVHTVAVDAFWIEQTKVTNVMFSLFLNERGNQVEEGVRWLEPGPATEGSYTATLTRTTAFSFRRPATKTTRWSRYRGTGRQRIVSGPELAYPLKRNGSTLRGPQSLRYPWGDTFDGTRANCCDVNCTYDWRDTTFDDGAAHWTSVGSYPDGASWCGALDMAGNVREWLSYWWSEAYNALSPIDNPQGPDSATIHPARRLVVR